MALATLLSKALKIHSTRELRMFDKEVGKTGKTRQWKEKLRESVLLKKTIQWSQSSKRKLGLILGSSPWGWVVECELLPWTAASYQAHKETWNPQSDQNWTMPCDDWLNINIRISPHWGYSSESLKRTPKGCQDLVFWAWLEFFFTSKSHQF